ncbi:uncharacterized protein N7477_003870 [Penicillium maclennaniae]|uniref:uncharacterized protein n=1 Tax=Penicillium maclennaniae TaxID=1343394 RepID=UPI00253FA6A2|nr:uncharacterized protein N7477_003870 [Penicillium maclennaniae]KAJ5678237.1 hypothetical protein N7477_003870 [Penicillium maclennaniae]
MADLTERRRGILRSIAVVEGLFGSNAHTLFAGLATTLLSKCEPQPDEDSDIPEEVWQVQELIDCLFPGADTSNPSFQRRYSESQISSITAEELQTTSLTPEEVIWVAERTSTLFNFHNLEALEVTTDPLPEEFQQCNGGECGICYESPTIGMVLVILPCQHWYCGECILRWLFTNPTCPACRQDALPTQSQQM